MFENLSFSKHTKDLKTFPSFKFFGVQVCILKSLIMKSSELFNKYSNLSSFVLAAYLTYPNRTFPSKFLLFIGSEIVVTPTFHLACAKTSFWFGFHMAALNPLDFRDKTVLCIGFFAWIYFNSCGNFKCF